MTAKPYRWSEVEADNPIDLLHRKRLSGDRMLVAHVNLEKGCDVADHHHESEQIAILISGHVRWRLGEKGSPDYRELEMSGGEVMVLPSNYPHGITALEDTLIIDVLSPPAAMGVDSQGKS